MVKTSVTIVLVFACAVALLAQSVRDEAAALVLRAEKTVPFSANQPSFPYHERVKFTLSAVPREIEGEFIKDYLSRDRWREKYKLGEYLRITVRNGQQLGDYRSAAFEPLWIDELRRSLPPVSTSFEHSDRVSKIAARTIHGVPNRCIEYEISRERSSQKNELCVSVSDGTPTSLRQHILVGACVIGCDTETEWSDYSSIGDKLYPRHLRLSKRRTVIKADIELVAGDDLNPAVFQIPSNLEIRKACDKITPPVRAQGNLPRYPHRINEFLFEGTVAVQARIGVDGRVQEARIASPRRVLAGVAPALEGRDVENAVLEAVRGWVFEPARCDGIPMVENTLITFEAEIR
jgi:hypothetical protein